jgi:hypothetical protein
MSSLLASGRLFKVMAGLVTFAFVSLMVFLVIPPAVHAGHDGT